MEKKETHSLSEAVNNGSRLVGQAIHPWAWWGWAFGCAGAASLATNPWMTLLIAAAVITTMLRRRGDAPWARSLKVYLFMAAFIVTIRVFFAVFFGATISGRVLFTLPEIPLPKWAAGIRIGGAVVLENLLYSTYDALRLGLMLLCFGAANTLANPRQILRSVPGALYEASVATVVALSVAPQLIESAVRVHRARLLRGHNQRGVRGFISLIVPVFADAVDRSLSLAQSMEVRGFGRTNRQRRDWASPIILVVSTCLLMLGAFLLLGTETSKAISIGALVAGLASAIVGIVLSGRRLGVSRYRPLPWGLPEWGVLACGLAALGVSIIMAVYLNTIMNPSTRPATFPPLDPGMIIIALFVIIPGFATPEPPHIATVNNPPMKLDNHDQI